MKSSDSFTLQLPKSFLLLGPPGTGKSTLAMQLPKPFILDCDDNLNGPVRFLRSQGKTPSFKYDTPLRDDKDQPVPREKQADRISALLNEAATDPTIETIIIDSLTSFVRIMMMQTLVNQGKKLAPEIFKLDTQFTLPDWGAFASLMTKTIFWLKSTGKRIVFTGHTSVKEDEISKILYNFISIPGDLKNNISGWFEEVWLFYIETKGAPPNVTATRKIRTVPDTKSTHLGLKTAAGLGNSIDANMDEILKKLTPQ